MDNLKNFVELINHNTGDLVFLISVEPDNVFRCIISNQSYPGTQDLENEILPGKCLEELWSKENFDLFLNNYISSIQHKKPVTYKTTYNSSAPSFTNLITLNPIYSREGICTHVFCVSKNVINENDKLLKESTQLFRDLFEYSPLAIFVHNKKE